MKLNNYKINNWDSQSIFKTLIFKESKILILDINETILPTRDGDKNLLSVNFEQDILWVANLPQNEPIYARYDDIKLVDDLLYAWCGSYLCRIDPNNGIILNETFIK